MGLPNGSEWLILVLVLVLLFGAKKLPEAARGLGRSLRIFKSEVTTKDEPADETESGSTAVPRAGITQTAAPSPAPIPPAAAPGQAPATPILPVTPAPVTNDSTNVQSVNEHFYGQERSDR